MKRLGVASDVRQVDWRRGTQQGAETVSHKDYVDCNVSRSFPQQLSQTKASLHGQKAQRVFHLKRDDGVAGGSDREVTAGQRRLGDGLSESFRFEEKAQSCGKFWYPKGDREKRGFVEGGGQEKVRIAEGGRGRRNAEGMPALLTEQPPCTLRG